MTYWHEINCIIIIIVSIIISSLRALRRARDGAAKGRRSWERIRWPDAKFEVTSAKSDLGNEQQREKREERRRSSPARGGWVKISNFITRSPARDSSVK